MRLKNLMHNRLFLFFWRQLATSESFQIDTSGTIMSSIPPAAPILDLQLLYVL